jgi:hypothetical protein
MTPARVVRWLLLPVFAVAAVSSNLTLASAASCEDIDAYQKAVGPGSGSVQDLSVGVVIHIMERPGHSCEVRKIWTPEQVTMIFSAGITDQRNVNSIWGSTKIGFIVHEVVLNEDDPPAGMVDSQQRIMVPLTGPKGTTDYENAFDSWVAGKHRDHKANVYLWREMSGKPVGFGRSTRSGNGRATVFLDNKCAGKSVKVCATYAAHELGHTLGLYHAGRGTCSAIDPQFRNLCSSLAKPCPGVRLKERLMTPGALGRTLCPAEVEQAELMATTEFQ